MERSSGPSRMGEKGVVRNRSLAKIYLTAVDIIYEESALPVRKRANSLQPKNNLLLVKEMLDFEAALFKKAALQHNTLQVPGIQQMKRPSTKQPPKTLDELSYPQLMDMFRSIISQKADADRCYFYVDDEHTIRLEKLLGLPNSFEVKRGQITEKEKVEKARREAIEIYYTRANTPD